MRNSDIGFGHIGQALAKAFARKGIEVSVEKGLDLIPIVLNVVLWSAKHDSKSYVRKRKAFVDRLRASPMQVSEEVKALVRKGGCIFPESKE